MLLELEHVTGRGKGFALQDISFAIEPGYIVGLAGKNGAGKTTLFHYILDEKKRYRGSIRLCGADIHADHTKALDAIGFISEENEFLRGESVRENAALYGAFYRNWDMEEFIKRTEQMELPLNRMVGNLSRGEFIRFQLAFAMAHHPQLYLIDEATAGMDPVFRKEFFRILSEMIRSGEASVLMTTHSREELDKRMDYIGIMKQGKLVSYEAGGLI